MLASTPRLSICIPAYNRAAFIGETLSSIAAQVTPDVEVVVSDNASSDATREVVEAFRASLPRLRYWRFESNVGFSRNFMQSVDLATGTYAWLLGSDDIVRDGMLRRVLDETKSGREVYVFDRQEWNPADQRRWIDPVLASWERRSDFTLQDRDVLLEYLRAARGITALFSFISTTVFKRAAWTAVEMRPAWHECAFPHAMRLFAVCRRGGVVRYVRVPLVMNRLGNDSFNPGGRETIRRLLMDYDGYSRVIAEHWSDDPQIASAVKRAVRRTHSHLDVLKFRRIVRPEQLPELCRSLSGFEYNPVFVGLYRLKLSGVAISGLKRLFQLVGLSR